MLAEKKKETMVEKKKSENSKERKLVLIKNTYIPVPAVSSHQSINAKNLSEEFHLNINNNSSYNKFKQQNLLIHKQHTPLGNNFIKREELLENSSDFDFTGNAELEGKTNGTTISKTFSVPTAHLPNNFEYFYDRESLAVQERITDSGSFNALKETTSFMNKWSGIQYCCCNSCNKMKPNDMCLTNYCEHGNNEKRESFIGSNFITDPDISSIHDNFLHMDFKLNESANLNGTNEFSNETQPWEDAEIEISYELEDDVPIGGNELFLEKIEKQCNGLTTVMLKNIPNKYTQHMLINVINERFLGLYNFIYLPIDFRNKRNVGYAFINFIHPRYAELFIHFFSNYKLKAFKSNKICAVAWGKVQGLNAIVQHYKKSSIMKVPYAQYKPTFFQNGVMVSWPQLLTVKKGEQQKKQTK